MSDILFVGVKKSASLVDVNKAVLDWEPSTGPLSVFGHSDNAAGPPAVEGATVLGFNASLFGSPGRSVIVKAADLPAAITPTCKGKIYISGVLTDCVAYRP